MLGKLAKQLVATSCERLVSNSKSFRLRTLATQRHTDVHEIAAKGFSLQVEEYDRSRPGYPAAVVTGIIRQLGLEGPASKKVVDLAAGTGKFTRRLLEHPNLAVTAVEPNQDMQALLRQNLPSVRAVSGSATSIPAEDNSLDAVFVAQGFHWFATEAACREIHRVLKPGAGLCLLWNREDVSVGWIQSALADLIEPLSQGAPQYFRGTWKQPFRDSPWVRAAFGIRDLDAHSAFHRHAVAATQEQLWGRMLSKSYIAVLPRERQAELEAKFKAIITASGADFTGPGGTSQIPLVLETFIAYKQS